tara:strand:- start:308 stop:1546 length:1239 start_codon:yes stop_codon:yes gene_type:complete
LFFVFIVTLLINFIISKNIANPLEGMVYTAERFSKEDFSNKIKPSKIYEINSLAKSLNLMAEKLNERIRAITIQKNENDAILISMSEGVIATNRLSEIIKVNDYLVKLFDLKDNIIGFDVRTIIRNQQFLDFYNQLINISDSSKKIEQVIDGINKRKILCSGTALKDQEGNFIGNVIIVNDITKIKSLEKIRKDFVANVSHELKTPLTALKGYVETLKTVDNEKDKLHFLNILEKHTSRMNLIINDLLELSKLEESSESIISKKEINILDLINDTVNQSEHLISKKQVGVNIKCSKGISFNLNERLMQEALANLLNNAIQYSQKKSSIKINGFIEKDYLNISVQDSGIGFEKSQFHNIFKRFYRIDSSRSKDTGGTGLGLSIVKHIIRLHNGSVEVESEIGLGSKFTLIIPN